MTDEMLLLVVGGAGLGLFLLGLGVGRWLGRRADAGLRARAADLERDLDATLGRLGDYRREVEKHFGQTSDLFRDLTRQYTTLYAHLAEGARELCPERVPEIGRGLEGPLLAPVRPPDGSVEPPTPPDAAGDASEEVAEPPPRIAAAD